MTRDGVPVKLTSHEFRVLSYLMHHRDRVVSQSELTEHIYAQDFDRDSNTVEVFIARLRRKLGASIIETVRGLGYRRRAMKSRSRSGAASSLGAVLWTIGLLIMAERRCSVTAIELHPARSLSRSIVHDLSAGSRSSLLLRTAAPWSRACCRSAAALAPINNLRSRLAGLHEGRDRRIDGEYPGEIQPLVNDLNPLLEHREQAVQRAIAKAGDLAHGLKTPLAILAQEAERACAAGQTDVAAAVTQQVDRMRRQVDYHLAHARAAASGAAPGARCSIGESAEGLTRAHCSASTRSAGSPSTCTCRRICRFACSGKISTRCWATSSTTRASGAAHSVTIGALQIGTGVEITVDDDGSGLPEKMREAVLQRGVRADEAAPGSGLGLAIVRDLAEVYGGSVSLDASALGGLRARLRLPAGAPGRVIEDCGRVMAECVD